MSRELERVEVRREDLDSLRNAIAAVKSAHPGLTLVAAIGRGIEVVVRDLEIYFNGGRPFPERDGPLPRTRARKDPTVPGNGFVAERLSESDQGL